MTPAQFGTSGFVALVAMTIASLASGWIRRRDVDYTEGDCMPLERRWIQWGTCWPAGYDFKPRYDRPDITFRYILIRLPSWTWESVYTGTDRDRFAWCQRCLWKFGPMPWRMVNWLTGDHAP